MTIKTTDFDADFTPADRESISLLPTELLANPSSNQYHSNTLSFFKYAGDELKLSYLTTPEILLEQRSGEWFAPAMLLTAQFAANYPLTVSIFCNVLSSYIYDTFKGRAKPQVRLTVICERKVKSSYVQIEYSGDVEGLPAVQAVISNALQ